MFNYGGIEGFSAAGFDRWSRGDRLEVNSEGSPQVSTVAPSANSMESSPTGVATAARPSHQPVPKARPVIRDALSFLSRQLAWVWFLGALALSMRLAWGNYLFGLQLRRRRPIGEPSVLALMEECRQRVGVRQPLTLVEAPELDSPALFGCFRLKLLLPEKMAERFSPAELRHVFLHELAHVRRRDAAINWLTTILLTLHWFNPVLWFAFHRMRADREVACDALALAHAREGETKPYGQTVIKVLEGFTQPTAIPGLVGILEDKQQIKRRIAMIAQFKKSSGWPALAVALVALLGCVSLTDAKRDKTTASNHSRGSASSTGLSAIAGGQPLIQKIVSDAVGPWVASSDADPSPDGRYLSYVNWTHGNLAVYDTKIGEMRNLTTAGTWNPPDQFTFGWIWSPDSTQIAYLWMKGESGDLRIIHRDGGKPRILVPSDKGGRMAPQVWSKDGRFILATTFPRSKTGTNHLQIQLVEVATGKVRVVKEFPGPTAWVTVTMSPDEKHIAYDFPGNYQLKYMGKESVPNQIRIVDLDGSNDRLFIDHPANDLTPKWMPDGKHLLFLSDRSGEQALWAAPVKDGKTEGESKLVRDGIAGARLLGTASDGTIYTFTRTPRMNVFTAKVDFETATMQPPKIASLRNDGRNRSPRWSGDGTQLAYVSRRHTGDLVATAVFQDAATGRERVVENFNMTDFWARPLRSPDLSKLIAPAMVLARGDNSLALQVADVATGQSSIVVARSLSDLARFRTKSLILDHQNTFTENQNASYRIVERRI